jgi:hypothetical protein
MNEQNSNTPTPKLLAWQIRKNAELEQRAEKRQRKEARHLANLPALQSQVFQGLEAWNKSAKQHEWTSEVARRVHLRARKEEIRLSLSMLEVYREMWRLEAGDSQNVFKLWSAGQAWKAGNRIRELRVELDQIVRELRDSDRKLDALRGKR